MSTHEHLVTRARGLRGEHIKLLSREALGKLLQHVHRMTVWMTLSSHQHVRRRIQVSKFLRREVVWKNGSVKLTVSKAQGAKKVSWPLIQASTTFFQFQQLFSISLSHYCKIVTGQKVHTNEVLSWYNFQCDWWDVWSSEAENSRFGIWGASTFEDW
jgi:hypothetical protein